MVINIRLDKSVLKLLMILSALKFIFDWFITSKMTKIPFTALYSSTNILYFNQDSGDVVFSQSQKGILNINFNSTNLDHKNYEEDDPDTITLVTFLAEHIKFDKQKLLKKSQIRN